jgi:hypothetical protein
LTLGGDSAIQVATCRGCDAIPLSAHHGKRLIAKHLKILAAEEGTSVQALLEEALDLLFVKKGREHIERV